MNPSAPIPLFDEQERKKFTLWFVLIFYALAVYKLLNGLWLFQNTPFVFRATFDGAAWVFMLSGLHLFLLQQPLACLVLDVLFYSAPLLYWFAATTARGKLMAGTWMLMINWIYVLSYSLFPINSIEGHIAWLLMPLVLMTPSIGTFYHMMHGLRYFFFFFFTSAGCWKIYQGGVFESQQMTGILLYQHKEIITTAYPHWQRSFIQFLMQHPGWGYALYVSATALQLSFMTGFFTRRFDRVFAGLFLIFLVMDYLIMRITYFEVLGLVLPLFFSHLQPPASKKLPS